MMRQWLTICAAVLTAPALAAAADLKLKDSDVVTFLGDGVVARARYPIMVESFIRAKYRQPGTQFLINVRNNETPDTLLRRLPGEVFGQKPKPTIAVLCFGAYLTGMKALDPNQAEEFGKKLEELTAHLSREGCQVILLTPPFAEESRNRRLQEVKFNAEVLTPLCNQMKRVAESGGHTLIDWYATAEKMRAERVEKVPGFTFSNDGLNPTPEGQALAAALLLEHWGATPINETVELDWATGSVVASAGKVSAKKNSDGGYELSFQDLPMPWPGFAGRGSTMGDDWHATRFNQIVLTVKNLPETGLMMGDANRMVPVMPIQLQKGMNLAIMEALAGAPAVSDVWQLINTKNRLYDRLIQEITKMPSQPQLLRAHAHLIETYRLYYEGYNEILRETPHTVSLTITLSALTSQPTINVPSATQPGAQGLDPNDPANHPVPDETRKVRQIE